MLIIETSFKARLFLICLHDSRSYMSLPERNNGFSLKNDDDYSQKGVVETIRGGLNLYIVGTGPKCIIWNYNIKGFSLRRNRQLADLLADRGT